MRSNAVLQAHADCGPLSLTAPPALGYGKDDTITVTGRLSGSPKQVEMFEALNLWPKSARSVWGSSF